MSEVTRFTEPVDPRAGAWCREAKPYLDRLPQHMFHPVVNYILAGRPIGHFLRAVLSNDLAESYGRADDANQSVLGAWVLFLYNAAPSESWGSAEKVKSWQERGGLLNVPARQRMEAVDADRSTQTGALQGRRR